MFLLHVHSWCSAVHQNYVGIDSDKNPYFLSIVSQDSGNKCIPLYRAMLFRKQVSSLYAWEIACFLFIFASAAVDGETARDDEWTNVWKISVSLSSEWRAVRRWIEKRQLLCLWSIILGRRCFHGDIAFVAKRNERQPYKTKTVRGGKYIWRCQV